MKKATLYIVILGIACLGLGAVIGVAAERRYAARNFPRMARQHFLRHREAPHHWREERMFGMHREMPKGGPGMLFERLDRKLDLSAEQNEKIQAILEQNKEQIKQARDGFKTQLEQVKESCHAQILEILKPEQKEKFEQMTSRMEERREKKSWR